MVIFHIHKQDPEQAQKWLATQEKLLATSDLPESDKQRQRIHILYYQAQLLFKAKKYVQAQQIYQETLHLAQSMVWHRAVAASQNWLAMTEIELGNLELARDLLEQSLQMAETYQEKRLVTFNQCSFATLEKANGRLDQAQHWAEQALEGFENLKMAKESADMRSLLQELVAPATS
jgi:tetratricopeptide (TPR) repeat protein